MAGIEPARFIQPQDFKCLKGKLQEIKKVNKITTIDKNIKIDKDTNVGEIVNTDKKNIVVKDHEKLINYDFVPTSVLCDLSVLEYETNTIDKDIIYIGYKYEKAFETPIKIDKHQDIYYYSFAELIKERIVNNEPISFKELDKLKLFFNINLNYSISYKEKSNKIKMILIIYHYNMAFVILKRFLKTMIKSHINTSIIAIP